MQQILYRDSPYIILWYNVNLQAYRTDRWTGYDYVPKPTARRSGTTCAAPTSTSSRAGGVASSGGPRWIGSSSLLWSWSPGRLRCCCAAGQGGPRSSESLGDVTRRDTARGRPDRTGAAQAESASRMADAVMSLWPEGDRGHARRLAGAAGARGCAVDSPAAASCCSRRAARRGRGPRADPAGASSRHWRPARPFHVGRARPAALAAWTATPADLVHNMGGAQRRDDPRTARAGGPRCATR